MSYSYFISFVVTQSGGGLHDKQSFGNDFLDLEQPITKADITNFQSSVPVENRGYATVIGIQSINPYPETT